MARGRNKRGSPGALLPCCSTNPSDAAEEFSSPINGRQCSKPVFDKQLFAEPAVLRFRSA